MLLEAAPTSPLPPGSPQPHPLVLIDELGKGTDVAGGTALAGAMLEALLEARTTGVFATHLHLLASLPLRDGGLARWRMEVVEDDDWGGRWGDADPGDDLGGGEGGGVSGAGGAAGGGPREYPLAGAREGWGRAAFWEERGFWYCCFAPAT